MSDRRFGVSLVGWNIGRAIIFSLRRLARQVGVNRAAAGIRDDIKRLQPNRVDHDHTGGGNDKAAQEVH